VSSDLVRKIKRLTLSVSIALVLFWLELIQESSLLGKLTFKDSKNARVIIIAVFHVTLDNLNFSEVTLESNLQNSHQRMIICF